MTKVEEALAEIVAELARIAPIHEGLQDFALLDIKPETKAAVQAAISQYNTRVSRLNDAKTGLQNLLADGYPTLEIPPVEAAVLADLSENQATIAAALAQFTANEAVTLSILPGQPTDKT